MNVYCTLSGPIERHERNIGKKKFAIRIHLFVPFAIKWLASGTDDANDDDEHLTDWSMVCAMYT